MNQNFQLQITAPCHENWDCMNPKDLGRYCGSCKKTVVDFTAMTDPEIIAHLARSGQNVCGRLAPDQLNRDFSLRPPSHNRRWKGWYLVLAGLLVATRLSTQTRLAKNRPPAAFSPLRHQMATRSIATVSPLRQQIASVIQQDSLPKAADSFKVLPEVVVRAYASQGLMVRAGGIVYGVKVSRWQKRVADTLAACHLLPKKELTIYPNPAPRGSAISLSWQTEPGEYQVALFDMAGASIMQRVMQVGTAGQIDLWEIPAGISGGTYIIRAIRAGSGKMFSRKLVVL